MEKARKDGKDNEGMRKEKSYRTDGKGNKEG